MLNSSFIEESRVDQIDPVAEGLERKKILYSPTPNAFLQKSNRLSEARKARTAIIGVDALRMTSTLVAASAAGVRGIHVAVKTYTDGGHFSPPTTKFGPWLGGGEIDGKKIPGGVIGNSPAEVQPNGFRGKYLKFLSTNGARAVEAVMNSGFKVMYLATFANIKATLAHAVASGAECISLSRVDSTSPPRWRTTSASAAESNG